MGPSISLAIVTLAFVSFAACKPRAETSMVRADDVSDPKAVKRASFETDLMTCARIKLDPPGTSPAEKTALKKLFDSVVNSECTGCHTSTSPTGDPARLVVLDGVAQDTYLTGLAYRHHFTHSIVKTCMKEGIAQQTLLNTLNMTNKIFQDPTGKSTEDHEDIAAKYLSGAFDEPVSEEPKEHIVAWLAAGGNLDLDHHIGIIMSELDLLFFNSNDPEKWNAPTIVNGAAVPN